MHPADWKALDPDERFYAAITGTADPRIHWSVTRIAELTGLDPEDLWNHLEVERGWESHDTGYRHEAIISAAILLHRDPPPAASTNGVPSPP